MTTAGTITPTTAQPATLKLWSYLPTFVQQSDAEHGYQFLSWLDGIGQQIQPILNIISDNGTTPGWSTVLDVGRCPEYALPWLGQFVGVRFHDGQVGTTFAMRQEILNLGNFTRGTPAAIAAALYPLLGTRSFVQIIERYPDPYSFRVVVSGSSVGFTYAELAREYPLYSEVTTAFPTYGTFPIQNTAAVEAALAAATPGGLISTLVFTEG